MSINSAGLYSKIEKRALYPFRENDVEGIRNALRTYLGDSVLAEQGLGHLESEYANQTWAKIKNRLFGVDPHEVVAPYVRDYLTRAGKVIQSVHVPPKVEPLTFLDKVKKVPWKSLLAASGTTAVAGSVLAGVKYKQMLDEMEKQKQIAMAQGMGIGSAIPSIQQQQQMPTMKGLQQRAYPSSYGRY